MPQILVTQSTPGTPVPLSATVRNFRHATMIACKSYAGPTAGPNTGKVRIGLSATASQQPVEFNPGDERNFTPNAHQMFDLSQYYLDADNAGDGVVILYQ